MDIKKEFSHKTLETGLDVLQKGVGEEFVYAKEVVNVLYNTIVTGENCILHGPGGYGKSEMVQKFLELCEIPYTKVQCFEGMAPEDLIGPPDMNKLTNESVLEYNFASSPFSKEHVLIFEEMLDARPQTLAVLKDILTSGQFQGKKVKSGSVIVCTNINPESLYSNPSIKALFSDRFLFKKSVVWKTFNDYDYEYLLDRKFGDSLNLELAKTLSNLFYMSGVQGSVVSPRVAINTYKAADKIGLSVIKDIREINSDDYKRITNLQDKNSDAASLAVLIQRLLNDVQDVPTKQLFDGTKVQFLTDIKEIGTFISAKFGELLNTDCIKLKSIVTAKLSLVNSVQEAGSYESIKASGEHNEIFDILERQD